MIGRRVLGALLAALFAIPLARGAIQLSGLQRSTWMVIDVDSDGRPPPPLRVAYGAARDAVLPVTWEQDQSPTLVGLRSEAPVRLLRIDTDRGAIAPWLAQTWAARWQRLDDPPALRAEGNGALELAGSFRSITLTFAASNATVDVGWGARRAHVDLRQMQTVTLTSPRGHRGWVLLPPSRIKGISLVAPNASAPFAVRAVALRDARGQAWSPGAGVGASLSGAPVCRTAYADGALRVETAVDCEVPLAGVKALNEVSPLIGAGAWLLIAACLAAGLALLRWIAGYLPGGAPDVLPRPSRTVAVLIGVTATALAYHLSYAFAVPAQFSYDSLGYWAFGHNFLHSHSLGAIGTCRTPGYPAAIALSVAAFGERLRPLVVGQQLALCLVAPLTVWTLYPRVGIRWAALAGLLAGISPIMALAGNIVWTEALFSTVATSALLLFVRERSPGISTLVVAGAMTGMATLIRPNGVVITALMAATVFGRWWVDRTGAVSLAWTVKRIAALGIPFVLVTAMWIGHFHRVTGHWGLSDANCSLDGQTRAMAAANLKPTNIFQLAAFINVMTQSDRVAQLAISEPYRAFFEFFPAQHRYNGVRLLPWDLISDDRMPGEIFREYLREDAGFYLLQVTDALVFNLTRRERPGASIIPYTDMQNLVQAQRSRLASTEPAVVPDAPAPAPPATLTWADADVMLSRLSADAGSLAPTLGRMYLRLGSAAMWSWWMTVACAAGGCLACLWRAELRPFTVLGAHAFVLAAAPAVLGMGADRYAMAGEPALYVLAVLLGASVVRRRRAQRSLITVA